MENQVFSNCKSVGIWSRGYRPDFEDVLRLAGWKGAPWSWNVARETSKRVERLVSPQCFFVFWFGGGVICKQLSFAFQKVCYFPLLVC